MGKAVHVYQVGAQTKVMVAESMGGWFPGIMKVFSPKYLNNAMAKSLETLKAEAEKV